MEVSPRPLNVVLCKAPIPGHVAAECAQAVRGQARVEQWLPAAWGALLAGVLHSARAPSLLLRLWCL